MRSARALDFAVLLSILLGSNTIRKDIALQSAQFLKKC
jgi:hypothetical protein